MWIIALVLAASGEGTPKSLYQLHLPTDISVTAGATAALVVMYALQEKIGRPRCPCPASEVPAIDRWQLGQRHAAAAWASDITTGLAMATPLLISVFGVGFNWVLVEDVLVLAETLTVTALLYTSVEFAVNRPRPGAYTGQSQSIDKAVAYRSFYSGHTALGVAALFAASFILSERYDQKVWPWIVSTAIGTGIGAARIFAGAHFLSDNLMGLVMGAITGVFVPLLHLRDGPILGGTTLPEGGAMVTLTQRI